MSYSDSPISASMSVYHRFEQSSIAGDKDIRDGGLVYESFASSDEKMRDTLGDNSSDHTTDIQQTPSLYISLGNTINGDMIENFPVKHKQRTLLKISIELQKTELSKEQRNSLVQAFFEPFLTLHFYQKIVEAAIFCCKTSVKDYEIVLSKIWAKYQGKGLEHSATEAALKAVKGLYTLLCESDGKIQRDKLYLPGRIGESFVMQLSTDVVIADLPPLDDMVTDLVILANLEDRGVNILTLWEKLPDMHKPMRLSKICKNTTIQDVDECATPKCKEMQNIVSSAEVSKAIISLIRHVSEKDGQPDNEVDSGQIESFLASVRFFSCSEIITCLQHEGRLIQNKVVSTFHWEEVRKGSSAEIHIFVPKQHCQDIKDSFIKVCADLCRQYIGMPTGAKPFVPLIFDLAYDKKPIEDYLNLPGVGSYIHVGLHIFLDQNPKVFKPGQFVAYELCDPALSGQDGDGVYVVARIVEEIDEVQNACIWQKKYKIDVGEIIEATGADLYMFLGELHSLVTGTEQTDSVNSEQDNKSLEDVKREISKQLEEAWKTGKEIGKKASKRLLLKWRMDENSEISAEAAEYIYTLVEQFEKC